MSPLHPVLSLFHQETREKYDTLHTGMLGDIQVSFVRRDGPIHHSQGLVSHETNSCKHTQSVQQSLTSILNSTGPKQLYYNQTVEQTIDTLHIVIFLPVEAHLSGLLTFQVSLQQVLFEEVYLKSRIHRESQEPKKCPPIGGFCLYKREVFLKSQLCTETK